MEQLGASFKALGAAIADVIVAFFEAGGPWWPLIVGLALWIGFWLFAVNWTRLYDVLWSGGLIGVVLIAVMWILVWGVIAPPADDRHHLLGLSVSNFVGKSVYVVALYCIAALCGSAQLSGALGRWGAFPDEESEALTTHVHNAHEAHPASAAHH